MKNIEQSIRELREVGVDTTMLSVEVRAKGDQRLADRIQTLAMRIGAALNGEEYETEKSE